MKHKNIKTHQNEKSSKRYEKKRNESFIELLDMSSKDGDIVDDILNKAFNNKKYKEDLKKFTKNINHHGISIDGTKKHYSLIWNRLK